MNLEVNGEIKEIKLTTQEATLTKVIKKLDFNPSLIVVELNGAILAPKKWDTQKIKDGDKLEIVTIVGGGS